MRTKIYVFLQILEQSLVLTKKLTKIRKSGKNKKMIKKVGHQDENTNKMCSFFFFLYKYFQKNSHLLPQHQPPSLLIPSIPLFQIILQLSLPSQPILPRNDPKSVIQQISDNLSCTLHPRQGVQHQLIDDADLSCGESVFSEDELWIGWRMCEII